MSKFAIKQIKPTVSRVFLDETQFKTFNDWSNLGYLITAGSKATWFKDVPKFHTSQVVRKHTPTIARHSVFENYEPNDTDGCGVNDPFGDDSWWLDY